MSRLEEAAVAAWRQERAARKNPRHGFDRNPSIHDPRSERQAEAVARHIISALDPELVKKLEAKFKAVSDANLAKA